jgi:hypothetical protein
VNEVQQIIARATDIFIPEIVEGFPARNMNLRLGKTKDTRFGGFGIYSIVYEHPTDGRHVIYLGSFAGTSSDASKGDVRTIRWSKHIGTANLLLNKLTMTSEKYYRKQKQRAEEFYKDNKRFKEVCQSSFLGIDEETLIKYVFRDSMNVSWNRLGFAIQNLLDTNKETPHTLEGLIEIVSRFSFYYWRVNLEGLKIKSDINKNLKEVEASLITRYVNQLPMNDEFPKSSNDITRFFHYDPAKLIKVGSIEFDRYCKEIQDGLEALPILSNGFQSVSHTQI